MDKKTIKDIDIKGKRVFIRVDFNVPIKNGVIEDDTRISGAMPTISSVAASAGSPAAAGPMEIVMPSAPHQRFMA